MSSITRLPCCSQAADGTLQLQSAGLPLSDQPLRWLRPLHRPPLAASLPSNDRSSVDSQEQQHSAVRQQLQNAAQQQVPDDAPGQSQEAEATGMQPAQAKPSVSHLQGQGTQAGTGPAQADVPNLDLQRAQQQIAATTAQEGGTGPDAMQIDSKEAAIQHPAALHESNADTSMQSVQAAQEHLTLHNWLPPGATQQQSQRQQQHQQQCLPSLPEDMQERVRQNVAKCDRQLLGRQEALLARWLPQRVEDEVRSKHGAADVDDTAVGFVQQVWHTTPEYYVSARNQCTNTKLLPRRFYAGSVYVCAHHLDHPCCVLLMMKGRHLQNASLALLCAVNGTCIAVAAHVIADTWRAC